MLKYRNRLYWTCLKFDTHVFKTVDGKIPDKCPFCDSRKVRGCTKDWYDTMKLSNKISRNHGDIWDYCKMVWGSYNAD